MNARRTFDHRNTFSTRLENAASLIVGRSARLHALGMRDVETEWKRNKKRSRNGTIKSVWERLMRVFGCATELTISKRDVLRLGTRARIALGRKRPTTGRLRVARPGIAESKSPNRRLRMETRERDAQPVQKRKGAPRPGVRCPGPRPRRRPTWTQRPSPRSRRGGHRWSFWNGAASFW